MSQTSDSVELFLAGYTSLLRLSLSFGNHLFSQSLGLNPLVSFFSEDLEVRHVRDYAKRGYDDLIDAVISFYVADPQGCQEDMKNEYGLGWDEIRDNNVEEDGNIFLRFAGHKLRSVRPG